MSEELLFTSAPQGLKPGSSGFCTVVCTQGMAKNLSEQLESLSGYRQAGAPPHPVNYSHLLLSMGGRRYHVLSRIADAGIEYTGRTNKLAHHVVLTPGELASGGPAWVLASPGFCRTAWDGKPVWTPGGPAVPPGSRPPGVCRKWEQVAGDAGWAGVLAESAVKPGGRPMNVIFRPGDEFDAQEDALALVLEAMSLLPPGREWQTTFSTYFTKLPAGIECQWRFLLDGSPEAEAVRRNRHAPQIDLVTLAARGVPAPPGELIEAARSPHKPDWTRLGRPAAPAAVPRGVKSAPSPAAPHPPAPAADPSRPRPAVPTAAPFDDPFAARSKSKAPWIVGGVFGLLALSIVAAALVTAAVRKVPTVDVAANAGAVDAVPEPVELPPAEEFDPTPEFAKAPVEEPDEPSLRPLNPVARVEPQETGAPPEPEPDAVTAVEAPPLPAWNADIVKRERYLPLPRRDQLISDQFQRGPVEIGKIYVADPDECELSLIVNDAALSGGGGLVVQPEQTVDDPSARSSSRPTRSWGAVKRAKDTFGEIVEMRVGSFILDDQSLQFEWNMNAPNWSNPQSLQYCLLVVRVGGEEEVCFLGRPDTVDDARFDLTSRNFEIPLKVKTSAYDDPSHLRVDLTFAGFPSEIAPLKDLRRGDEELVVIEYPAKHGNGRIELPLKLDHDPKKGLLLRGQAYVHFRLIYPDMLKFADQRGTRPIILKDFSDFKRDDVPKVKADLNRRIQNANNQIQGLTKRRETAQQDIRYNEQQQTGASDERKKRLQERINDLRREVASVNDSIRVQQGMISKYMELADIVDSNRQWCDEMHEAFREIQDQGRIGYSVYVEIEGKKVYLARSRSAVSEAAQSEAK